jgi:aldose 1-epimerase
MEQRDFGCTPLGERITIFTLQNNPGIQIRIINLGAAVQSLIVPDQNGFFDDIVLGYDHLEGYLQDTNYMGATIGRYANRIAGGGFSINGTSHALSRNNGRNHLHGGSIGYDKTIWDARPYEEDGNPVLELSRISRNREEGYPGNLVVSVRYCLTSQNEFWINYQAKTDRPTPVNLTHHSYFNLSGGRDATIENHRVWINADHFLPVDEDLIPTGEFRGVSGTPFDFRAFTPIAEQIDAGGRQLEYGGGYDHTWVFNDHDRTVKLQAAVCDPGTGRMLEVLTSEPGLQFYSGNSLQSIHGGKRGVPHMSREGLCLETQHFPDSPNQSHFPSTILHPGEWYQPATVYRFKLT